MNGPLGEGEHPDFNEHLVRAPELVSRVTTTVLATQPFTIEQVRTGVLGPGRALSQL